MYRQVEKTHLVVVRRIGEQKLACMGVLHDARDSHLSNVPRGYEHILDDEPEYCGFLRGRVATWLGHQLIVVYCREDALSEAGDRVAQFLTGLAAIPVAIPTFANQARSFRGYPQTPLCRHFSQ